MLLACMKCVCACALEYKPKSVVITNIYCFVCMWLLFLLLFPLLPTNFRVFSLSSLFMRRFSLFVDKLCSRVVCVCVLNGHGSV